MGRWGGDQSGSPAESALQLLHLQHLRTLLFKDVTFDSPFSSTIFAQFMFEFGRLHPGANLNVCTENDWSASVYVEIQS